MCAILVNSEPPPYLAWAVSMFEGTYKLWRCQAVGSQLSTSKYVGICHLSLFSYLGGTQVLLCCTCSRKKKKKVSFSRITILLCPGMGGFPGCGNFNTQIRKVLVRLGWLVTLSLNPTLYQCFSAGYKKHLKILLALALRELCKTSDFLSRHYLYSMASGLS